MGKYKSRGKRGRWKFPVYAPHAFRTKAQAAAEYRALAADWERIYITGGSSEAARAYPPTAKEKRIWRPRIARALAKARELES